MSITQALSPTAYFQDNHKLIALYPLSESQLLSNLQFLKDRIKVIFLEKGNTITIDFKTYDLSDDALFFVNVNQYVWIDHITGESNKIIGYNRDFYCIQIHDKEVACDGLLFSNVLQLPMIQLATEESNKVKESLREIQDEMDLADSSTEEMLRIYLKKLIIFSTRIWKKQNLENKISSNIPLDVDLFRNFSQLIEIHYRSKHSVSDYADLLEISPKILTTKFKKLNLENPNEYIKNRIILEAKRLLIYTSLSIKEIAYTLGYDDPAYFNRFFVQRMGQSPLNFRNENSKNT